MFFVFQTFYVEIKNQFGASIDVLRSDNAKEFFSLLFVMREIILFISHHVFILKQNDIAELKNRHLLEVAAHF